MLGAIGNDTFEPAVLSYLDLIVRSDRLATVWMTDSAPPRIDSVRSDPDYQLLVARQLGCVSRETGTTIIRLDRHGDLAATQGAHSCDDCAPATHLRTAGLMDEMRVTTRLDERRQFVAFFGRLSASPPWTPEELDVTERSVSLLHSIIVAHGRCKQRPQAAPPVQITAERRLVRAFEERGLTTRESEIASKILFGYSTTAISMDLSIAENTVKVHRKHLNQKLGVRSQGELFGFAYKALMGGEPL